MERERGGSWRWGALAEWFQGRRCHEQPINRGKVRVPTGRARLPPTGAIARAFSPVQPGPPGERVDPPGHTDFFI